MNRWFRLALTVLCSGVVAGAAAAGDKNKGEKGDKEARRAKVAQMVEQRFAKADGNKDKQLDKAELKAFFAAGRGGKGKTAGLAQHSDRIFARLDANSDNGVSAEELKRGFAKIVKAYRAKKGATPEGDDSPKTDAPKDEPAKPKKNKGDKGKGQKGEAGTAG